MFKSSNIQIFQYSNIQIFQYSKPHFCCSFLFFHFGSQGGLRVHFYALAHIIEIQTSIFKKIKYSNIPDYNLQIFKYYNIQLKQYSNIPVLQYSNIPIFQTPFLLLFSIFSFMGSGGYQSALLCIGSHNRNTDIIFQTSYASEYPHPHQKGVASVNVIQKEIRDIDTYIDIDKYIYIYIYTYFYLHINLNLYIYI